ncbi:MAG: phage capsid protein, partial [Alphaproteobacteria bacterium]
MSSAAAQTQYRQEFISGFEQRMSLLRQSVTKEAMIKGNQATFLVADSGQATAQTRGANGKIPARSDNLAQPTATLVEKHDLVQRTGFDVFASQGDGRRIMQETSMAVINRDIDQTILAELSTATQDAGSATTASLTLALKAKTILGNNQVPFDNNISAVITP